MLNKSLQNIQNTQLKTEYEINKLKRLTGQLTEMINEKSDQLSRIRFNSLIEHETITKHKTNLTNFLQGDETIYTNYNIRGNLIMLITRKNSTEDLSITNNNKFVIYDENTNEFKDLLTTNEHVINNMYTVFYNKNDNKTFYFMISETYAKIIIGVDGNNRTITAHNVYLYKFDNETKTMEKQITGKDSNGNDTNLIKVDERLNAIIYSEFNEQYIINNSVFIVISNLKTTYHIINYYLDVSDYTFKPISNFPYFSRIGLEEDKITYLNSLGSIETRGYIGVLCNGLVYQFTANDLITNGNNPIISDLVADNRFTYLNYSYLINEDGTCDVYDFYRTHKLKTLYLDFDDKLKLSKTLLYKRKNIYVRSLYNNLFIFDHNDYRGITKALTQDYYIPVTNLISVSPDDNNTYYCVRELIEGKDEGSTNQEDYIINIYKYDPIIGTIYKDDGKISKSYY